MVRGSAASGVGPARTHHLSDGEERAWTAEPSSLPATVLISTYELGHQPFGLGSPAAWLRDLGANVTCLDLAVQDPDEDVIRQADLIGFTFRCIRPPDWRSAWCLG